MPTTTENLDLSQLESEAARILDVYRRSRGIYERTMAAMGRVPRFHVVAASTATAKIDDVKYRTS